jgi:hypothetical protein
MDYVYHANLQETYSISYKTSLDYNFICVRFIIRRASLGHKYGQPIFKAQFEF